jgi:Zn-dependent protease
VTRLPTLKAFGLPLRTSWMWIAVALAMTAISISQLAPQAGTDLGPWLTVAAILAVGTLGSILLHDYGHLRAARRVGQQLNSIEPSVIGALPDTCYAPDNPSNEVRIALAGPAVNLLLAGLFAGAWILAGRPADMPGNVIPMLALVNVGLTLVGLLPGYPFDGGRVFRAWLWYLTDDLVRSTRVAAIYGHVLIFIGLLGGVVLLSMGDSNAVWGTWVLILCWTINRARSEGVNQTLWSEAGRTLQIDDLFQAGVNRVSADATIDQCIESLLDNFRRGPTLVVNRAEVIGIVDLAAVRKVPRANWTQTTIGSVMSPLDELPRMNSSTSVTELLAALPGGQKNIVLVENQGKIVAAADRDFVMDRVESYIRAQTLNRRRRR